MNANAKETLTIVDGRKLWLCVLLTACSIGSPAQSQLVQGTIDVHWNEGSEDCVKNPQPPIQVHRYNAQTFILRESLCATYEAPFIYLLIGKTKGLLIDTGAVADAKAMPLAQTVISLLENAGSRLPLMVVHTHGHLDHRSGDDQFRAMPDGTNAFEIMHMAADHSRRSERQRANPCDSTGCRLRFPERWLILSR